MIRNSTLVIDPVVIFCSFSGSTTDNWGFTATYGPDGSMYGGGIVFGTGFPTSPGAYQTAFQGGALISGSSNFLLMDPTAFMQHILEAEPMSNHIA